MNAFRESQETISAKAEAEAPSNPSTSEIFSGTLGVKESLNKLRSRLLDLSARNRLLNFKHSKAKSLQFVGVQNLDGQFERLLDGKAVTLRARSF